MELEVRKTIKDHSLPKCPEKSLSPKEFAAALLLFLGAPHKGISCSELLWTCVQGDLDLRTACCFPF